VGQNGIASQPLVGQSSINFGLMYNTLVSSKICYPFAAANFVLKLFTMSC